MQSFFFIILYTYWLIKGKIYVEYFLVTIMLKLSVKFYGGIAMIFLSLIIGKITFAILVLNFRDNNPLYWWSLIIYILSWPMLIIGVWWVGEEYYRQVKRYISYKFYHESVKSGTKKVYHHTKSGTQKVYHKTRHHTKNIHEKVKGRLKKKNKKKIIKKKVKK
tara:strand:- start:1423 stop:1911 length:489 start_codon:yes stop_codon:yes gene_type:complete